LIEKPESIELPDRVREEIDAHSEGTQLPRRIKKIHRCSGLVQA
jgi:hypothetical protein